MVLTCCILQAVSFCVADVRQRLKEVSTAPFNTFARDPEDPSGMSPYTPGIMLGGVSYCYYSFCYEGAMARQGSTHQSFVTLRAFS